MDPLAYLTSLRARSRSATVQGLIQLHALPVALPSQPLLIPPSRWLSVSSDNLLPSPPSVRRPSFGPSGSDPRGLVEPQSHQTLASALMAGPRFWTSNVSVGDGCWFGEAPCTRFPSFSYLGEMGDWRDMHR